MAAPISLTPPRPAPQTMPALFRLFRQNFLPRDVRIVGYARTKMDHDEFLKRATSNLKVADDDQKFRLLASVRRWGSPASSEGHRSREVSRPTGRLPAGWTLLLTLQEFSVPLKNMRSNK